MDDGSELPWSGIPSVEDRTSFLQQMEKLASSVSTEEETHADEPEDEATKIEITKLKSMMENGNFQETFFYARRLVAQGKNWAEEWMSRPKIHFEEKICNRARNYVLAWIHRGGNELFTEV